MLLLRVEVAVALVLSVVAEVIASEVVGVDDTVDCSCSAAVVLLKPLVVAEVTVDCGNSDVVAASVDVSVVCEAVVLLP